MESQNDVEAKSIGERNIEDEVAVVPQLRTDNASLRSERSFGGRNLIVPLRLKIIAVLLVTGIGFGSNWASGITGAVKTDLKKAMSINNAQFAVLTASEDFIKTALILVSGIVTDRIGGANAMLYGNALYSVGAILIAASTTCRNYQFMIFGSIVQAFGDVATQVAQYKIFSSWFAPSNGFASTLGFELGIGKIGSFVGSATANVIADNLGDVSWVYWMAVVMNIVTNVITLVFWLFTRYCERRYSGTHDPATGEKLTEKNDHFSVDKMLRLPWTFYCIIAYTAFQTSTASVFTTNATELAEQRFNIDSVTAGWYSSMSQYLGFFLVPLLGIFIDTCGQRLTVMFVCGAGMFLSMALCAWGPTISGTAASFGVYAFALSLGPTVIIDSIRTTMLYQDVFGTAYAIKIAVNNAMTIILRIVAGVLQDQDNNSFDRVVIIYVALAAGSVVVGTAMLVIGRFQLRLGSLQWSRKKRISQGDIVSAQKVKFEVGELRERHRKFGLAMFAAVNVLVLGSWAAYFWGVATGNNS